MAQSIYEKYGGYDTISTIVYELYQELCDHPEIAQHFIGIDLERLIKLQTQFVSIALGAKIEYTGRPMHRAHHHLHITPYQYEIVKERFLSIFKKHGFEQQDLKVIEELLTKLSSVIVSSHFNILDLLTKPIYKFIHFFENTLRSRGAID